MPVTLPDDTSDKAVASIKRYFSEQLDQEIGELQGRLLLEFFLKEIGPSVYNAAIGDARRPSRSRGGSRGRVLCAGVRLLAQGEDSPVEWSVSS